MIGTAALWRPPAGMMVRLLMWANLMAETMSCSVLGVMMMAGGEVMRVSDQRETILVAGILGSGMEKGEVRREVDLNEESVMVFCLTWLSLNRG